MRIVGAVALAGVVALAVVGAWLAQPLGKDSGSLMPHDVPLAALMYFWFGFDLETGDSEGGVGSSHWNTDYGTHNSRVGVTDEPEYGYYASDDVDVIARQLEDMELAGISIIIASWHGNGDIDLDGAIDDQEKKANHRAIKAMLDYIRDNQRSFKVAILVEPYFGNSRTAESLTVDEKQDILDLLWGEFYEPYSDVMFRWKQDEGDPDPRPLVIPWASVDLKEAGDSRFTVKNWSSTDYPDWKGPGNLDWNWYPDPSLAPNLVSDDGVFVVFPRFDESWQAAFGKVLDHELRVVDPFFAQSVYEQMWQAAVDYREDIRLLVLYSWNEHEEHASIEPDKGISPVSYGRTLVEKTGEYYRRFLVGEDIAGSPDVWSQPRDLKQFIGALNESELGLGANVSLDTFLSDRLRESQSLVESRLGRTFASADVPPAVKNIQLRLASNIYNYILMNKRNPVTQVGEFNFQINDDAVFTNALKADLSPFRARQRIKVLYP